MHEKACDEAVGELNPDAWFNASIPVLMKDALHVFRQEYLTSLGSSAKDFALENLYEAISDTFKGQLKFNHHFGKVVATKLQDNTSKLERLYKGFCNKFEVHFPPITRLQRENVEYRRRIVSLENDV